MSRKKTELWAEAVKHKQPLKYAEFKCPICGGVATIVTIQNLTTVECHACGAKIRKEAYSMKTKNEVMESLEKLAHHLVMSLEGMVRIGMIERDEAITHVVDVMNREQKRVSELNDTQIALEMLSDMPPKIRQHTIEELYKESFE